MTNQINCVGCDESPGSILMQSSVLLSKMFEEVTGIKGRIKNLWLFNKNKQKKVLKLNYELYVLF